MLKDHFCPHEGVKETQEFREKKKLHDVIWSVRNELMRSIGMGPDVLHAIVKGEDETFSICVATHSTRDQCLVYVSSAFQSQTGYGAGFAEGRCCRFLQPTSAAVNDAYNLKERARLRAFCAKSQPGSKITSLLLNERSNGKRFWNLLFMLCLEEVNAAKQWETERYIIGVQTIVYYQ